MVRLLRKPYFGWCKSFYRNLLFELYYVFSVPTESDTTTSLSTGE